MGFPNQFLFKPSSSGGAATGSAGDKNYLGRVNGVNGNGDFETGDTTGWSKGTATLTSNLPTGAPTFGSGASANLTLSAVTSGKLAGSYSLSYASSAATTAGDFVASSAFTIDTEDQAKVMTFKFYYSPTVNPTNGNWSGTTSNSFGVAVYDVTNSAWIIPAGIFSMTQSTGVGYATGTFQTTSNSTSYRLVVYNANATSNSITVLFDDFFLGPQTAPFGPITTDWVSYTPTGNMTTAATYTGKWRRIGDTMEIQARIAFSGSTDAVTTTVNLPAGYTIDTAKILTTTTNEGNFGNASGYDSGVMHDGHINYAGATTSFGAGGDDGVGSWSNTVPFTIGNGDRLEFNARFPVTGWSSSLSMSNDTDTRVVAFRGTNSAGTSVTATPAAIPFATTVYDTHGAFSTSTYTAPVSGLYRVALNLTTAGITLATNEDVRGFIYKNGSAYAETLTLGTGGSGTSHGITLSATVQCNAGDTIQAYFSASQNTTLLNVAIWNSLNIERVSGPAVVAATEDVNARYYASATAVTGSLATVVWTTKDYDSHLGMASGVYTVPVSGKYQVNTALALSGTFALNNQSNLVIQKNSSTVSELLDYAAGAETADHVLLSDIISCVAGDTLKVQVSSAATGPGIVSSNTKNFISIARIGN